MTSFIVQAFHRLSRFQKIVGSFAFIILLGSFLLMLPISNQGNQFLSFIDALFMASSAACVTGLAVVAPATQFTLFGQIVLLLLIQIGGFSLISVVSAFFLGAGKRLSIKNKLAIKTILNQNDMLDFKVFILRIFKYAIFLECIGAIALSTIFIPEFGIAKGIYVSIFTSVSAFCNAGFDVIGSNSLALYVTNIPLNIIIMILIIVGGLGFVIYFDIHDKYRKYKGTSITFLMLIKHLSLQTKIVLAVSALLIFLPACIILFVEYNNPDTLGNLPLGNKIITSLFSSVTLRTAGFSTLDFSKFFPATHFIMIILMFIGGSPGGTAGGIKTTTIAVLLIFVFCSIREQERPHIFRRSIPNQVLVRAMAVFTINLVALFSGVFLLLVFTNFGFVSILFEATSALATVGLSFGITSILNPIGKMIVIMLMFVGRVGIITFLVSLLAKEKKKSVDYAEGSIMIG